MALGLGPAAVGANQALQELLARRFQQQFAERQQTERERANQAQESYRRDALTEQGRLRQATLDAQQKYHEGLLTGAEENRKLKQEAEDRLRQAGEQLNTYRTSMEERLSARDKEIASYHDRIQQLNQDNAATRLQYMSGQLDLRKAQQDIDRNRLELERLQQDLRARLATPESVRETSKAKAEGAAEGKGEQSLGSLLMKGAQRIKSYLTAPPATQAPPAPAGWRYVPKPGGGWTAIPDKAQ